MPAPSIHAFAEKVAVITNGTDPIGRAVALQLALQGSYVIVGVSDPNAGDLAALEELRSLGTLASFIEADISTEEGGTDLIGAAASSFGRIDLLVDVLPADAESAGRLVGMSRSLMDSRPKPKIVNVSRLPEGDSETLNGIAELTERLAAELPSKYRINSVAVGEGFGGTREGLDPELFPFRGGIDADDVARVVLFLLSAESTAINGRNIPVGR